MKKYIFTETGEVRFPKKDEWYFDDKSLSTRFDKADCDYIHNPYPIFTLEIIEEKWKPKEGEKCWGINFYYPNLIYEIRYKSDIWQNKDVFERLLERNLLFPFNKESDAIATAKKMLEAIK